MKIVVWDSKLSPHIAALRQRVHADDVVVDATQSADVVGCIAEAEIIVTSSFPTELAGQASNLRLLHAAGAGTDGIALDALGPEVMVATTGHHEDSIAEYVVMALIALQRSLRNQDTQLRAGRWSSAGYDSLIPQPLTLSRRVATFLGFGAIGQASWRALRHFGVEGIAITRSGATDAKHHGLLWSGRTRDLNRALQESDLLIVSVPLDRETRGIVGATELENLGGNGLIVNVARGPVVDERSLFDMLRDHKIAGAAIDVWFRYPGTDGYAFPSDLPFGSLDNILMTPHSSGVTQQTFHDRAASIADNINRFRAGTPLRDGVVR